VDVSPVCPRVTCEWARLREVIVGRPFYRIPAPFPAELVEGVPEALWRKVKAREGQTMETAMPAEYLRCADQIDAVVRLLEREGVKVHRVPAFAAGEEDYLRASHSESMQFFPRDPILVVDDHVVELCLRDGRRRRERTPLRRLLDERCPATVLATMEFPDPPESEEEPWPYLEGGDCLVLDDEVLVGVGSRGSNAMGADWLQKTLGESRRVTQVALSADFPHLDLALGFVRPGLGIVCREALPQGLPHSLKRWEWLEISRDDALVAMAANGMPLDARRYLLPAQAHRVAHELTVRGCAVTPLPFDTVTAFKGGLRCWSHPLARWD
jgi:glycine amidinotransferase